MKLFTLIFLFVCSLPFQTIAQIVVYNPDCPHAYSYVRAYEAKGESVIEWVFEFPNSPEYYGFTFYPGVAGIPLDSLIGHEGKAANVRQYYPSDGPRSGPKPLKKETTEVFYVGDGQQAITDGVFVPRDGCQVVAYLEHSLALKQVKEKVKVNWKSTGKTFSMNVIERSGDGSTFDSIGYEIITNDGSHTFLDDNPRDGRNIYRIRDINHEGVTSFSGTASIYFVPPFSQEIEVWPNPVYNGKVTVAFSQLEDDAILTVVDLLGRDVASYNLAKDIATYQVDMYGYVPGVYIFNLLTPDRVSSKRVVVK